MQVNKVGKVKLSSKHSQNSNGAPIYLLSMDNGEVNVVLSNLGATITAIWVPDRNGMKKNIVAGYGTINNYLDNPHYYGCLLGRCAGRIDKGQFKLNDKTIQLTLNDGSNHLHGGAYGFSKQFWKIRSFIEDEDKAGVTMEYLSKDGEEGYPGNLWVSVQYTLDTANQLTITYNAITDISTPVNLSNHSYFNLSGFNAPTVLEHTLQINAASFTEKNSQHLPTGNILPVAGTGFDFTTSKKIGHDIDNLPGERGFNHNFVLNKQREGKLNRAATLRDEESGRVVTVYTDQPCLQVYTANDWQGAITGSQDVPYLQFGAIALETQGYPDAPNHPVFPDSILLPGQHYHTTTIFKFNPDIVSE